MASTTLHVVSSDGPSPGDGRTPRIVHDEPSKADRRFNQITFVAGLSVLILLALVGLFLLLQSRDALEVTGPWQFLMRKEWRTDVQPPRIGVWGLLVGTILVALVAISLAVPLGILCALFITEHSTARTRKWLTGIVDLLADCRFERAWN